MVRSILCFNVKSLRPQFLYYAYLRSEWTNSVLLLLIFCFSHTCSAVFTCVGSQGAGCRQNVGSVCVCLCVCPCVPPAFVFLSQFYIPALRGECFLWDPLLFFNIYLTFCLSSDYWNDCKLVWNNRLLQSFVSGKKIWWWLSEILYYKWFSFYFCTYVLCTAVNCIPEMIIKDVL